MLRVVLTLLALSSLHAVRVPSRHKTDDPCSSNGTSCECFEFRDPSFCNTCGDGCGYCQTYCNVPTPAPTPEPPCAPPQVSCACWGDPHCRGSFFKPDQKFNFQGRGLFRYAASIDSSFEVQTFQCQWGNRKASVISAMAVKANGHVLTLVDHEGFAVDGAPYSDGDVLPDGLQITKKGAFQWDDEWFHFYTHRKLTKKFNQTAHRMDIKLRGANASSEGVCGNPDAGRQNLPDSDSLFSTAELNQLYTRCGQTPDQLTSADVPEATPEEACAEAGIAFADAEGACQVLKDQDDFYQGCIFDFCAGDGDNEMVVEAEEARQTLEEREQLFSSRPCGPCDEDPESCACFFERDPNFCNTCRALLDASASGDELAIACGTCQDFCGVTPLNLGAK